MKIDVLNGRSKYFFDLTQTHLDESDYEMGRYYQGVADGILEVRRMLTEALEERRRTNED